MKDKLIELNEIANRYDENLFSEVNSDDLSKFEEWLPSSIRGFMKEETQKLYSIANGFEFNGLIIYSLDKNKNNCIYELNEEWHDNEELKQFIFFGDSDITWYCYDTDNSCYCELDKPSGTLMEKHENFSELILSALNSIM